MIEEKLQRAIGLADCCELMTAVFGFPTKEMAQALSDGMLASDAQTSLADAGAQNEVIEQAHEYLKSFEGCDAQVLFETLRRGNTIMYLTPGTDVPVWPYESPFRFVLDNKQGTPSLFRSPKQLDVERHMKEAGVMPKNARTEPADSAWSEFSFMSYLYASLGNAIQEGSVQDETVWSERIVSFWNEHARLWLPAFMDKTIEEAPNCTFGCEYIALANLGKLVLGALETDIKDRKNKG